MSPVAKRRATKTLLIHNDRFYAVNPFVVIKSTIVSQSRRYQWMDLTFFLLLSLPENKCCNVSTTHIEFQLLFLLFQ